MADASPCVMPAFAGMTVDGFLPDGLIPGDDDRAFNLPSRR